jgi:hypothetical protein
MIAATACTACAPDPITFVAQIKIDRIEIPLAAIAVGILSTKRHVELG